jgi:hypothetical protein
MDKGDTVLIIDKTHSWYGQTGTLGEELSKSPDSAAPKGMYKVELDNGMSAGCYLNQLEKL